MDPILQNAGQRGMSALNLGSHNTASPFLQWVMKDVLEMMAHTHPSGLWAGLPAAWVHLTSLKIPMARNFPVLTQECQGLLQHLMSSGTTWHHWPGWASLRQKLFHQLAWVPIWVKKTSYWKSSVLTFFFLKQLFDLYSEIKFLRILRQIPPQMADPGTADEANNQ